MDSVTHEPDPPAADCTVNGWVGCKWCPWCVRVEDLPELSIYEL